MIELDIKSDVRELYKSFEVKLESVVDKLLLFNANNNDSVLLDIRELIEKVFIMSAMRISNNNISRASRLLGINRNTLSKKLKELEILPRPSARERKLIIQKH